MTAPLALPVPPFMRMALNDLVHAERAVAEAASIADLAYYGLLRPVLLELKRRTPCEHKAE